jgi:hypothetical protein
VTPAFNNGTLEIYQGTQPTNADTAIGAQVKLGTYTFATPAAFGAAAGAAGNPAVATANTITGGVRLNAGQLNINHVNALGPAANTLTVNEGTVIDNTSGSAKTLINNNVLAWIRKCESKSISIQ